MDNDQQQTPGEFARELWRRGLAPMRLDGDVEEMILGDVGKFFTEEDGAEEVWAFAA